MEGPGDASVLEEGMEYCALARKNHERERERETAEGGIANCLI